MAGAAGLVTRRRSRERWPGGRPADRAGRPRYGPDDGAGAGREAETPDDRPGQAWTPGSSSTWSGMCPRRVPESPTER